MLSLKAAVGNIPVCAAICGHSDYTAYYGCRVCEVKATPVFRSRNFSQAMNAEPPREKTKNSLHNPHQVHKY